MAYCTPQKYIYSIYIISDVYTNLNCIQNLETEGFYYRAKPKQMVYSFNSFFTELAFFTIDQFKFWGWDCSEQNLIVKGCQQPILPHVLWNSYLATSFFICPLANLFLLQEIL